MQVSGQTVRSRFIGLKEKLCQQHGHFQGEPALALDPRCRLPISHVAGFVSHWPAAPAAGHTLPARRMPAQQGHGALGGHQGSRQADRRGSRPVVRSVKSTQRFYGCLRGLCPHFPSPRPALHHDARAALAVANQGWSSAPL
jgi:hypothetical protein